MDRIQQANSCQPEPYTAEDKERFADDMFMQFDEQLERYKQYAIKSLKNSEDTVAHPLTTIDARMLIILAEMYESLAPEVMDAEERELLIEELEEADGTVIRITAEVDSVDGLSTDTVGEIGVLHLDKAAQRVRLRVGEGVSEDGDVYEKIVAFNFDEITNVQMLWTSHWSKYGYPEV